MIGFMYQSNRSLRVLQSVVEGKGIGSFRLDYEYEIEYEYEFPISNQ